MANIVSLKCLAFAMALLVMAAVVNGQQATCDNNGKHLDTNCCPGAEKNNASCDYGYGYCKPVPPGSPPGTFAVCTRCAGTDKPCCPGRDQVGATCHQEAEMYGVRGYCKASKPGSPTICTRCGVPGEGSCCPGDAPYDPCDIKYQDGYCKVVKKGQVAGTSLKCVACGGIGQECCPDEKKRPAKVNSICRYGLGFCKAIQPGGNLICTACGAQGQPCCPGWRKCPCQKNCDCDDGDKRTADTCVSGRCSFQKDGVCQ